MSGSRAYAYGWLLVLIGISLIFQLGASNEGWSRIVTVVLQAFVVIAALRVSGARRRVRSVAATAAAIAVVGAIAAIAGTGELSDAAARLVGLVLVLVALIAIVNGIVRELRETRKITIRTMFGVLCVYLLAGTAFGFTYGLIGALSDAPFFAQIPGGDQSDYLYFSFATLTNTGWGDLTAATNLGRSFAVSEALVGQIYLVTIVALIVGNLGRPRPLARMSR